MQAHYYQRLLTLLSTFALLLLNACHFTVASTQMVSPLAQPLGSVNPTGMETTLTSADEFTSYTIIMRTEIGASEVLYEYSWQKTDAPFGFDAHAAFTLTDPPQDSPIVMKEEEYLVGDKFYQYGIWRQWSAGDRAAVTPMLSNSLFTLELAGSKVYLPVSALVQQSTNVGQAVVNGVLTDHFVTTDTQTIATLVPASVMGPSSNNVTAAQVDLWRAVGDGTVIKYLAQAERYRNSYEVSNINTTLEITAPEAGRSALSAKAHYQQMKESGQIEHPVCNTCIFPIPPDAESSYSLMSDGRILDLYLPVGGPTAAQTAEMYKTKLQEFGWQITQEEASANPDFPGYTYFVTDGVHQFQVRIATTNVAPGKNQTQIEISLDPPFPVSTDFIVNTGQFEHTACSGCIFPAPLGSGVFPSMMGDHLMEVHCPETMNAEEVRTWYQTKLSEFGWNISKEERGAGTHLYLVSKDGQHFSVAIMGIGPIQVNILVE